MDAWICTRCGERNGANARQCWRCSTHVDGSPAVPEAGQQPRGGPSLRQMECLRCPGATMAFIGRRRFHEGAPTMPFLPGDLGELFVHREEFDLYTCPSCGKVELFLSAAPY